MNNTEGAVLFADICDSVRMYQQYGSARGMEIAEKSMEHMMRVTERHGGAVIRTQGDGVKSLFPNVDHAYDAATGMQACHRNSPCCIKVAFSYGAIMNAQDDVFGDTVHLAARLLNLAKPGEILVPGCTAQALSANRKLNARLLDTTHVKGMPTPVEIYTIIHGEDGDTTCSKTLITLATPARALNGAGHLVLQYAGGEYRYENTEQAITIGRADTCDVMINSRYASRLHARIEVKRNYFLLTDQSTNGTFVVTQDNETVFLKRESVQLIGKGIVSLGRPPSHTLEGVLRYYQIDPE